MALVMVDAKFILIFILIVGTVTLGQICLGKNVLNKYNEITDNNNNVINPSDNDDINNDSSNILAENEVFC